MGYLVETTEAWIYDRGVLVALAKEQGTGSQINFKELEGRFTFGRNGRKSQDAVTPSNMMKDDCTLFMGALSGNPAEMRLPTRLGSRVQPTEHDGEEAVRGVRWHHCWDQGIFGGTEVFVQSQGEMNQHPINIQAGRDMKGVTCGRQYDNHPRHREQWKGFKVDGLAGALNH